MKNTVFVCFLMGYISFSQVADIVGSSDLRTDSRLVFSHNEVDIEGTRYINELYKKGITIVYGKEVEEALMRYDAYSDAMEVIDDNGKTIAMLRQRNTMAKLDGKTYVVFEYMEEGKYKLGYFNPLNNGKVQLLWKPKKIFVPAKYPDNGYDSYSPPTFKDVSSHYIKAEGFPAKPIKLSKRNILKYFGTKNKFLNEFININNLDLKEEEDVLTLIKYYNSQLLDKNPSEKGG